MRQLVGGVIDGPEIGLTKSTYLAFTNPMVAVLVEIVFAHEPLTLGMAFTFPLIITGTYLSISANSRQRALRKSI